jgi:hypothetical protein
MEAILLRADGTQKKIKINTTVEARGIICNYDPNGFVETVKLNDDNLLLIDEDGKNKNYPINVKATELAHHSESIFPSDYIVGDVLLFENGNFLDDLDYE